MYKGHIFRTYLKSLTPVCLFTIELLWHYNDIQEQFTLSMSNVKAAFWVKI